MRYCLSLFFILVVSIASSNGFAQDKFKFSPKEVYRSKTLVIIQIAANSFQHISYLQTNDFGNVPCNGLLVRNANEVVIFDTPTNDESAFELINWVEKKLNSKIKAVIPMHFHDDCLGGLKAFHERGISSYAFQKTIEFTKANHIIVPLHDFSDSLILNLGKENILVKYFGEGHTKDNVVGYFAADKILFGGCLVKESGANKGFLGDANVLEWPNTVAKVKSEFKDVEIVVPGHGQAGGVNLLDYTIKLFKDQ